MRRLIFFVEGEGESNAVPTLVKRVLKEGAAYDLLIDDKPFRVGSLARLVRDDYDAARNGWGSGHSPNTAVWVTSPLSSRHTWS